jgi:site-specific recombinase XerD
MGRFFKQAAERVDVDNPGLAHTLRRAPPHWMRHTHATHALGHAAELTTVRCQLGSCLDLDHVDLPAWGRPQPLSVHLKSVIFAP